jgi:hypothetical protein
LHQFQKPKFPWRGSSDGRICLQCSADKGGTVEHDCAIYDAWGAASAPRAAENNLAVLVLKVLIEPQAGTGLGYDGGERYTNNNSGLRRVRTKVFEIRE